MNESAVKPASFDEVARMGPEELERLTGLAPPRRRPPGGPAVIGGLIISATVLVGASTIALLAGAGAIVIGGALMMSAQNDLNAFRRRCWAALVEERAERSGV
jgi:hypothetical protein